MSFEWVDSHFWRLWNVDALAENVSAFYIHEYSWFKCTLSATFMPCCFGFMCFLHFHMLLFWFQSCLHRCPVTGCCPIVYTCLVLICLFMNCFITKANDACSVNPVQFLNFLCCRFDLHLFSPIDNIKLQSWNTA